MSTLRALSPTTALRRRQKAVGVNPSLPIGDPTRTSGPCGLGASNGVLASPSAMGPESGYQASLGGGELSQQPQYQ